MTALHIPKKKDFKTTVDGKKTTLIHLKNAKGMQVFLTNYGARIVSILVPDKNGNTIDVNLGHAHIDEYIRENANFYGAIVGRVCGRIRNAEFTIDGEKHKLTPNDGKNFIHGGVHGFNSRVFEVKEQSKNAVAFSYLSKDGEEGFPGNLRLKVYYELTMDNEIKINSEVHTDKQTPFNMTSHAFFNLNGEGSGNILNHKLKISTNKYLPITDDILPVGKISSVENTPFDFTSPKPIGKDIQAETPQIQYGTGYDHTFVLKDTFTPELIHAGEAVGDKTGIKLEVYTNQPGIHLYTGNFMEGSFQLKSGETDKARHAFCLETQHLADALHQPHFPSMIISPDEKFETETRFKFSPK